MLDIPVFVPESEAVPSPHETYYRDVAASIDQLRTQVPKMDLTGLMHQLDMTSDGLGDLRSMLEEEGKVDTEFVTAIAAIYLDKIEQEAKRIYEDDKLRENPVRRMDIHDACERFGKLLWVADHNKTLLSQAVLARMMSYLDSANPALKYMTTEALEDLTVYDNRAAKLGKEMVGVYAAATDKVVRLYQGPYSLETAVDARHLVTSINSFTGKDDMFSLFVRVARANPSPEMLKAAVSHFSDWVSFQKLYGGIMELTQDDPARIQVITVLREANMLPPNATPINDVARFYADTSFAKYSEDPQTNEFEKGVLGRVIKSGDKVLDIASGHGRHTTMAKELGAQVVSVDLTRGMLEEHKKHDPNTTAVQASWHRMPFADGSFDISILIGRSGLHNYVAEQWIDMLREIRRVTKGTAVIDKPTNTGEYKIVTDRIQEGSDKLNVLNTDAGMLVDSPNDHNFMQRLNPTDDQFDAMCTIAGYKATRIATRDYPGYKESTNTNEYWLLSPMSDKERAQALKESLDLSSEKEPLWRRAFAGASPPLRISFI